MAKRFNKFIFIINLKMPNIEFKTFMSEILPK